MKVNMDSLTELDLAINLFIQENLRTEELTSFMRFFTSLNNVGILAILTVLVFLFIKGTRRLGLLMAFSLTLEFMIGNLIIKPLVARPRPYEVSESVILLVRRAYDYSFPSGHTGSMFSIAVVMLLCLKGRARFVGWLFLLLSFLMGYSRLYVGIHYPSDVIFGFFLGSIIALFTVFLMKYKKSRP